MKKILSAIILTALIVSAICLTAFAANDFVGENEFVIASFNGINTYVKDNDKFEDFEVSAYWLADNKDAYNLKYVSFLGQIANSCKHTYASVITEQKLSAATLVQLSLDDVDWQKQYNKVASVASEFKNAGLPTGFSLDREDYVSSGYSRDNLAASILGLDTIMPEEANYDYLDDNNYCTYVSNNGIKYMIFQLEMYPRTATLDWFKQTVEANPDKYAIVCTSSFIDGSGAMYTMWDWNVGFSFTGTTSLKSMNITWTDKPRDGEALWDYALKDCDRLLAIICGNVNANDIVSTKLKGSNGNEVAVFGANADVAKNTAGSYVLMTKISADNTEFTCAWAEALEGVDQSSAKTIKLNKIGTLSEALVDTTLPKIPVQSNGSNTAYIFGYEGNTFRPNANMTRAEACTIFARLILGVQNIPDGYTTRFTDVKAGDWFHNAVAYLDQTGYFFRNKNTEYKPNEPITRAEFVDLANSASKLVGVNTVSFTDVPEDHFYYMAINAASASGLVNGYEDGTFRPDNTITRAEVVTVINRLLGLKASEKAISMDHLDNVFVDIGSHWAKLNILMASNSNVHTDNYYKASLDGVEEKPTEFIFANKHFSFSVNKKNGKVTEFINLATGEDILGTSTAPQFIYLMSASGGKLVPTNMETEGGTIKITFKNGYVVYLITEIRDNYMTFEIDSDLPASISSVTFANLSTNLQKAVDDDDYLLNAIGMTYWTNPVNKGYRLNASSVIAQAYTIYEEGTSGAKLGVVFANKANSIKYLQEVTDAIDPSVGLTSKAGGAYAKEWEGNFGDYALVTSLNPEQIEENLKLAIDLDIDQYDIHQAAGSTFRQGDFVFAHTETGTAKEYYDKIGYKIAEAGLKTGLHTYAYYIAYSAENILKEPKWQEDLEKLDDVYTLRKKMTKFSRNAATEEDASNFDMTYTFFYKNSLYIMIDNEIMKVGQGTSSGFINVERGQCGTDATPHAAGAKIYHLSGYFQMFVPKFGSDLFYHVADLTAQAYNDGGFDMIYLDAIDGINRHLPEGHQQWYWFHKFVHRIVSQCDRYPILETSSSAPQEWNVRGRTGAWDTANRSIKKMINEHMTVNKGTMENNMNTTLGWFSFFPDQSPTAGMKNTIQKTIFHDDFDALGMGALLYDMSIVFNPFNAKSITENPFHYENIKYYTETYTKLRKSHYFNADVISKVKEIGGEWRVIEKKPGEYVFQQMYYNYANLTYANDYTIDRVKGNNPFEAQTPFIRIESRYSTLFENPITLFDFGSNAISTSGGAVTIEKKLSAPIDMTPNMAMTLRVKGTGKDGDALLLSMIGGTVSGESGGRADYFVDLNFEGWRDVILLDLDSADYDFDKYSFSGIGVKGMQYATYRTNANYNSIMNLYIRLSGSTAYSAQVGELKAYAQTEAPIKNPTVTVGSSKVTFNCEMKGGEYLEYDPETGKAILYHNAEQTKEEVTFTGTLTVGNGNFEAVYTADKQTDAPLRARVTLGFLGQEIGNN